MKAKRVISPDLEIRAYLHCGICLDEWNHLTGISPSEYGMLEAGFTAIGIQVWCKRHRVNVLHIDFEGRKHPANTRRLLREGEA
jgi:hypothetical protein